jgi:hypothetical protein
VAVRGQLSTLGDAHAKPLMAHSCIRVPHELATNSTIGTEDGWCCQLSWLLLGQVSPHHACCESRFHQSWQSHAMDIHQPSRGRN